MTAPIETPVPVVDVPLEQFVESLRTHPVDGQHAEQQHQFLDIDPDLAPRWAGAVVHGGAA